VIRLIYMLKEERFDYILDRLKKESRIAYDTVAEALGVSEDTIRRDIEALHKNGLLAKVRGGAIIRAKNPLNFQDRSSYQSDAKEVIALKAQQFIKNGQTIFMDGGTTVCAIAAHFPINSNFRVITNNNALIPILARYQQIEVIVLGGIYNRFTETNTGGQTCQEAKNYIADLFFMGTCAIHSKLGVTAVLQDDGEVKQAMLSQSQKTIALTDKEKLELTEHYKVCDVTSLSAIITELPSDETALDQLRDLGPSLI
jgi:DeoR/GlpR family transcriptional regulator of sugar metabolism